MRGSLHVGWMFIFFNDTATTEIYAHSLHDALPICKCADGLNNARKHPLPSIDPARPDRLRSAPARSSAVRGRRSEEHTSELQSRQYLVCRLLLEKKKPTDQGSTTIADHGPPSIPSR